MVGLGKKQFSIEEAECIKEALVRSKIKIENQMSLRNKIKSLEVGLTRQAMLDIMGEPDSVGVTSRKYRVPSIFKYGPYQIFFVDSKGNRDGFLTNIHQYDKTGNIVEVILKEGVKRKYNEEIYSVH